MFGMKATLALALVLPGAVSAKKMVTKLAQAALDKAGKVARPGTEYDEKYAHQSSHIEPEYETKLKNMLRGLYTTGAGIGSDADVCNCQVRLIGDDADHRPPRGRPHHLS